MDVLCQLDLTQARSLDSVMQLTLLVAHIWQVPAGRFSEKEQKKGRRVWKELLGKRKGDKKNNSEQPLSLLS